jgi:hypothetical protein
VICDQRHGESITIWLLVVKRWRGFFAEWGPRPRVLVLYCLALSLVPGILRRRCYGVGRAAGLAQERTSKMAAQCVKKESNPPVCAIHGATLMRLAVPIDVVNSVPCYLCPVSRKVVRE